MKSKLSFSVEAQTDVGRKRKQNEDSFLVDEELQLFIVCDGMGGHAAGEVASNAAVTEVKRVIEDNKALIPLDVEETSKKIRFRILELLEKAAQSANKAIFDLSRDSTAKRKMGTTLTVLLLRGGHGFIAHVGDSRLYLVRAGKIHQLTDDHSLVGQYVRQGRLTKEEAKHSPYQNVLTRAVGVQEWVQIDCLDFELEEKDRFLIASDGLTGYFEDEELLSHLSEEKLATIPQEMITLANERGGKDNITAIVISIDELKLEKKPKPSSPASTKINSLKSVSIFQKLAYQQLTQVANLLHEKVYKAGEKIIAEGDPGEAFFILLDGSVEIRKNDAPISTLTSGDHFGEMALVDNSPRSADVFATTDCHVLFMNRADFISLIRRNPPIAVKFLWSFTQVLTQRLRRTSQELSVAFSEPVELTDLIPEE